MEDSSFDVAFHGTLVEDCVHVKNLQKDKIIVFSRSEEYGSTFDDVEKLKSSRYVSDVEVYKYSKDFLIEAYPMVLRPNGRLFNSLKEPGVKNFFEYITIDHHFLILEDGKYYKIPYTKTQLVDTVYFNFRERHLINKLLRGEIDLNELRVQLCDKTKRILFNGIVGDNTDHESALMEYLSNFGSTPFVFPKRGYKDISEILSRSNAMCGTAYLLDKNIKVYSLSFNKEVDEESSDSSISRVEIKHEMPSIQESNVKSSSIKFCSSAEPSQDNESSGSYEEEHELLDRFSSTKYNSEEEESVDYEEISSENDHTGQINARVNAECCKNRFSKKSTICFDPLGCDGNINDVYHTKEYLYSPEEITLNKCINDILIKQKSGSKYVIKGDNADSEYLNVTEIISDEEDCKTPFNTPKMEFSADSNSENYFDPENAKGLIEKAREGYKFLISSNFGNIYTKSLVQSKVKPSNIFVRVLNLREKLIEKRFFAFLYNGTSFIRVLSIDSSSECCVEGTFIIYLLKHDSKVNETDLKLLKIHKCNVISDVSYQINDVSLSHFE